MHADPLAATDAPVLALASALIARRSVTPDDAGCQALVQSRLAPLGFVPETFESGGVTNLWTVLDSGRPGPLFVFAGHTDVVPAGPREWWRSHPFEPTVDDGRLTGRGAADMKSSIAAFVVAVERWLAGAPAWRGRLALLLTSDEEGPATDGTVRVVEALRARGVRIDHCLVGEPTSVQVLGDMLKNGRRGSLSGRLVVRGIQGHVAYPHLARNPVHQFAPALAELVATRWDDGNAHFPPTTFQVSNVAAGTGANNIIPGALTVDFNFRFCTESTPESLRARVAAVLDAHGLEWTVDWTLSGLPFLTAPGTLSAALVDAIRAEMGIEAELSTSGGTSDGRFIAAIADQVIEFGPPNSTIHKSNECIDVAVLEPLAGIYRRTLERLLGP